MSALSFSETLQAAGLTPPNIIETEKLYRFPGTNKRSGNTAGWCKLFADGLGGVYGDFSQDFSATWHATRSKPLSIAQRAALNHQIAESKARANAERQARQSNAAMKASAIWCNSQPANDHHPYLVCKGIKAHGARLYNGALVIPMREGTELHSLQFIGKDGSKRFLTNGRIKGCYFSIGSTKDQPAICVAEGFATGATIHEATGYPVAVAFNTGNLQAVAIAMRAKETTWT